MLAARAENRYRGTGVLILAPAMVIAAVALTYWGRDQVLSGDALFYAQRLSENSLGQVILHENLYLLALPMVVYNAVFEIFGIADYLPFRLVAIALSLLCVGLFYAIAQRRIGLLALVPALLLLFFGSGWEVLITGMRIPSLFAIASGLGAILLLERENPGSDAFAAVLLCVSVTSHPTGLGFLAAATVMVGFRSSPQRWKSSWVVLIPAALLGAFLLFLQRTVESGPQTDLSDVLVFARDSWTTVTAAVTGLSGVLDAPVHDRLIAEIAALALLALILVGAALRWRDLRPTFWAAVAALVTLVVATRLSPGGFIRAPDEPRYLYPEAVLYLWILVELAAAWRDAGTARIRTGVAGLATAVLLLGLWSNVAELDDASSTVRTSSMVNRGQYSAFDLERGRVNPSYTPSPFVPTAGDYLSAAAAFGTIGLSPGELVRAPALVRSSADRALVGSLGLALKPARLEPPARRCMRNRGSAELVLPAGGAWIAGPRLREARLALGRFADSPIVPLTPVAGSGAAALRIPRDGARVPWKLQIASPNPVTVCRLRDSH